MESVRRFFAAIFGPRFVIENPEDPKQPQKTEVVSVIANTGIKNGEPLAIDVGDGWIRIATTETTTKLDTEANVNLLLRLYHSPQDIQNQYPESTIHIVFPESYHEVLAGRFPADLRARLHFNQGVMIVKYNAAGGSTTDRLTPTDILAATLIELG